MLNLCIVETYSHIFHSLPVVLQLKRAYRELARQLHPDKTGGDAALAEQMKELNTAYEVSLTIDGIALLTLYPILPVSYVSITYI